MTALPATSRASVTADALPHTPAALVIRWSLGSNGDWIECVLERSEQTRARVAACLGGTVRALAQGAGVCSDDSGRALVHFDIPGVLTATFRQTGSIELLYARSPVLQSVAGGQAGVPTLRCANTT